MGPTWDPTGADRTQVGPMLATWILLSGMANNDQATTKWQPLAPTLTKTLSMVMIPWCYFLYFQWRDYLIIWSMNSDIHWGWITITEMVSAWSGLTYYGQHKMADILETALSNVFSWMTLFGFWSKFHWRLFPRSDLTKSISCLMIALILNYRIQR